MMIIMMHGAFVTSCCYCNTCYQYLMIQISIQRSMSASVMSMIQKYTLIARASCHDQ